MADIVVAMDTKVSDDTYACPIDDLARYFVDAGRVVPAIATDTEGTRSWWWPLPVASDRELLSALLTGPTLADHKMLAERLAVSVDALMRERLADVVVMPNRPAKGSITEQWLASLVSPKPRLAKTLSAAKLADFVEKVQLWVATGVPSRARLRVVLRIEEPTPDTDIWCVRLLVQDTDEPSLIVEAESVWARTASVGPAAVADLLTGLGRVAQLAPELRGLLDVARPTSMPLEVGDVVALMRDRVSLLLDAGIGVTMPAWWSTRGRVRLRARATSKGSAGGNGAVAGAGFGFNELVSFTWEAALGGRKLTKTELASLAKSAASKQNLVKVRGEWVELEPNELSAMIAAVGTKGQARAGDLIRTAMGLGGLESPAGVTGNSLDVESSGWLGDMLDGALHSAVEPIDTPTGFHGTLRAYQARGVGWLVFLGRLGLGACLADDMGLGKTAQLIGTLLADPIPEPTLVVCPVSVLGNWQRELERFAPHLRVKVHYGADRLRAGDQAFAERAAADVVLTSYSIVARDTVLLSEVPWGRLVLDEAQQVKNPGTAQTKAIRRIEASRRIALTGTPVENRLSELWSLMHVLNPGLLGTASDFKRRFAIPIEVDHDAASTELLRKITGPFVLRRLKSDRSIIDDLPDKIEQTQTCALTREQATLYQAVVDDLLERADDAEGIGRRGLVLAGITKLKQVCNHPAHFARDGSSLTGRSGKLARVEELLDEIVDAGDHALCFTQFAEWGELLVAHFTQRYGEAPLWLHGGTPRKKRDEMVERFSAVDGPRIFLLSLKAGGTGLNLTSASHVIHLDRWWNPAVEDQATDRAYRIGQKRTVLVHKLVSAGTVEEKIDAMINSKRMLAASVVGTGEEWLTGLSTEELREVISLRESSMIGSE